MAARASSVVSDLLIPRDIAPGAGWSAQMREMAAHIGAYETLLISDVYGGQEIYIPADAAKCPFLGLIGAEKAKVLSWAYRRDTLAIPTARYALARARRRDVLADVRAGNMTVTEAARLLHIRRDYASKLLNCTDEGADAARSVSASSEGPHQIEMFARTSVK